MSNKKDYVYGTPVATEYRYYLDDSITDPQDYHELFELLANAGESDLVKLIISNFGGSLMTCLAIVNALRSSAATTIGVLTSVAYSAGGAIWLACNGQEVHNHVGFMAHDGNGASFGSLYQQKQNIEHEMIMLRSLYEDVYEGFFSQEEIEVILKNGDMWLNEKEIIDRLQKRDAHFKALAEEAEKKAEQEFEELFDDYDVPDWVYSKLSKGQLIQFAKGQSIITDWDDDTKKFTFMSLEEYENSLTAEQE